MLMKWRLLRAARLIRLRSTLRSKPLLAALVKTLHVPDLNIPLYQTNGDPNPEYDAYLCTLASVVMTCPNLEALTGFYCFYNHTFERLTHALSTRRKLRQHVWIIAENDDVSARSQTQIPPGLLDHEQTYQFTQYHDRWKQLETLMLCSPGKLGVIEHELFIRIMHSLPALRNLCISSFDADDFHDLTLLSLPPWLTTLRLEECLGVTDAGLTKWAGNPNATQIYRLSLLHQNITSLLTLSKIFASLNRLVKFTIVQNDIMPSFPSESRRLLVQPVLASKSLQFLHWDILSGNAGAIAPGGEQLDQGQPTPNMHLALSISNRGFPNLNRLRAPRDTSPPGILQSVCKVDKDQMVLPEDVAQPYNFLELRRSSSLRAARLRAQRITDHADTKDSPAPDKSLLALPMGRNAALQQGKKSSSDTSTSTLGSQRTVSSDASHKSTGTAATNQSHERVSPLSSNQDPFSPLAPDDGVVSPIGADHDQMYQSGGDAVKQAFAASERRRRKGKSRRDSICRCTLSPNMDSDSVCLYGNNGPAKSIRPMITVSQASPRGSFRPSEAQITESPRTRFPSLTIRRKPLPVPVLSFYLTPDVKGHDGNGGLIGWGDLLRVGEKARSSANTHNASQPAQRDTRTRSDENGERETEVHEQEVPVNMCDGSWNLRSTAEDQVAQLPVLKKILSAPNTSNAECSTKPRSRSMSKSSSRLNLPLGKRSVENETFANKPSLKHVARPRGDRGGCVTVEDFF